MKWRRRPKPTDAQRAGRAIRRGAQIIEDRGWVVGELGTVHQGFCMVGAITFGIKDLALVQLTLSELDSWLRPRYGCNAMAYNDNFARTKSNVVEVMRRCADSLDPVYVPVSDQSS